MTTNAIKLRYNRKPFNSENKSDYCLWCGNKLKKDIYVQQHYPGQLGYKGNGAFCSLRCGFNFGVTTAANGTRLKKEK